MRKPAIEARQGHARGIDDIIKAGENLLEGAVKGVKKSKKVLKDIPDPRFKKNPYTKKGGLTKDYKDYVLRNMKDY